VAVGKTTGFRLLDQHALRMLDGCAFGGFRSGYESEVKVTVPVGFYIRTIDPVSV